MTEMLLFGGLTVLSGTTVVLIIFSIFGKGLATRMFGFVVPGIVIVAIDAFIVGSLGLTVRNALIGFPIGITISVVVLIMLYRATVKRMSEYVNSLKTNIAQITSTAKQSAATASEQASTVAEISATIEEITQTTKVTSETAVGVVNVAETASSQGREGLEEIIKAKEALRLLNEIGEIVDTVNDLSELSNLLAVNASIEAHRAGEHGRGFVVVASEVRSLAEQSKMATKKIRDLLGKTEKGWQHIEAVHDVIHNLNTVLERSSDGSRQIAGASNQQAAGIQQISDAMVNVNQGGQDTAIGAKNLEESSQDLLSIASNISLFVNGKKDRAFSSV
jgi:methyl-accepting chemotaxis protein